MLAQSCDLGTAAKRVFLSSDPSGGWTEAPGDTTPDGLRPPQGVPFLDVRPAGTDVESDLVAIDLPVGSDGHALVVAGPTAAATAAIVGADGGVLGTMPLTDGAGSVPLPAGAAEVQALAADGSVIGTVPVSTGGSAGWGDYGNSITTSFSVPVQGPR